MEENSERFENRLVFQEPEDLKNEIMEAIYRRNESI
jgi:hypothetical protein